MESMTLAEKQAHYLGMADALIAQIHDGMPAWQEFRANTEPDNGLSLLQIEEIAPAVAGNETVLRWQSASNRVYSIWRSAALPDGFGLVATNLPADPPLNVYTDRIDGAATRFYRIEAKP